MRKVEALSDEEVHLKDNRGMARATQWEPSALSHIVTLGVLAALLSRRSAKLLLGRKSYRDIEAIVQVSTKSLLSAL